MYSSLLIDLILYALFALITLCLFIYIHQEVPEPYMDEYFHFHQAAKLLFGKLQTCKYYWLTLQKIKYVSSLSGIRALLHRLVYI